MSRDRIAPATTYLTFVQTHDRCARKVGPGQKVLGVGIAAEVYLVTWECFVEQWATQPKVQFWRRATEEEPDWLERYAPRSWQDSWRVALGVGAIYEQVRSGLSLEQRSQMDAFYEALFAGDGTRCQCDLEGVRVSQRGVMAVALSPASVLRLRQLGRTLPLEALRIAVGEVLTPGSLIETFDEFVDYWRQWARLLNRASHKKLGIVVSLV